MQGTAPIPRLDWSATPEGRLPQARLHRLAMKQHHLSPAHRHDFYEMFWIERGCGEQEINGQRLTLVPGDLVFMRPDDSHTHQPLEAPWIFTNLALSREAHAQIQARYEHELDVPWPWAPGPVMPVRCHLPNESCLRLQEMAASVPARGFPATPLFRQVDVDWLIGGMLRLVFPTPQRQREIETPEWMTELIRQLREDRGVGWNAAQLAIEAGLSRDHLSRLFRRHQGMSATRFLQHLRLEHAAAELRCTDRSILAIAQEAGFENLSYFHRSFKDHFGITPRHFRLRGEVGG